MRDFESIGQYHDYWATVLLFAPDRFKHYGSRAHEQLDQAAELRKAFDTLRHGFRFARYKLKDERVERIALELLDMSYAAYAEGDAKRGAHILGECEGLIWKGKQLRVKYGVEAERRAFGANVLYAGVRVSPYPYEGTREDLGADQAALLEIVKTASRHYQAHRRDVTFMAVVMDKAGLVQRISPDPSDAGLDVRAPLRKSLRAAMAGLRELAQAGEIRACALAQVVGATGSGFVAFDLEQKGLPRVSARQRFALEDEGRRRVFQPMHYHLEDPQFFPEPD